VFKEKCSCFFDGFAVTHRASDNDNACCREGVDASLVGPDGHSHSVCLLHLLDKSHLRSVAHGRSQRKRREIEHEHQRLQLLQTTTKTATKSLPLFQQPGESRLIGFTSAFSSACSHTRRGMAIWAF